jgi:hypothetical protein
VNVSGPIKLAAGRMCIEFARDADRYRHEIVVWAGDSWRTVLASKEGSEDDEWPPSPPLQELHIEPRTPRNEVALLVGRAGRSHWSLSVESDVACGALIFDVACRSSAAANRLQSSYLLTGPGLTFDLQILEGELRRDVDEADLSIVPRGDPGTSGVHTFRWRYKIAAMP